MMKKLYQRISVLQSRWALKIYARINPTVNPEKDEQEKKVAREQIEELEVTVKETPSPNLLDSLIAWGVDIAAWGIEEGVDIGGEILVMITSSLIDGGVSIGSTILGGIITGVTAGITVYALPILMGWLCEAGNSIAEVVLQVSLTSSSEDELTWNQFYPIPYLYMMILYQMNEV